MSRAAWFSGVCAGGQDRVPYLLTSACGSLLYSSIMFTADAESHPLDRNRSFWSAGGGGEMGNVGTVVNAGV